MKTTSLFSDTIKTPWGNLAVLWFDRRGKPIVTAAGFCSVRELHKNWSAAASRDESFSADLSGAPVIKKASSQITKAINDWAKGKPAGLRAISVIQPGPEFRQEVWSTLRKIRPGDLVTYQELSALAGRPRAVRATASACSNNLAAPFVPCHRVSRSSGDIGKYAYGAPLKKKLLIHEGVEVD